MILQAGQAYTLVVWTSKMIDFTSDDTIKDALAKALTTFGAVHAVERPLWARVRTINVVPIVSLTDTQWSNAVLAAYAKLGYDNARVERIEGGTQTTSIVKEMTGKASGLLEPITDKLKSVLVPVAAIALGVAAIYLAFKFKQR